MQKSFRWPLRPLFVRYSFCNKLLSVDQITEVADRRFFEAFDIQNTVSTMCLACLNL